ncbi:hypothetical protein ACVWWN_007575 [Mycobacterium sp. URHB0021]|jgi:hypothetical protein
METNRAAPLREAILARRKGGVVSEAMDSFGVHPAAR